MVSVSRYRGSYGPCVVDNMSPLFSSSTPLGAALFPRFWWSN